MRRLFAAARVPSWYSDWRAQAFEELLTKQKSLEADLKLGGGPRYDYDLVRGTLTFSDDAGPRVIGEIQAAGTTGEKDWLWSWANASLPRSSVEDALRVKGFGAEHGIKELTSDSVGATDPGQLGWELTAAAVRVIEAVGAYRAPSKSLGALFLLIRSIRFVS